MFYDMLYSNNGSKIAKSNGIYVRKLRFKYGFVSKKLLLIC